MERVAAYGIRWAARMATMSFLSSCLPWGVVVVRAPTGVAEDRCPPVFP